MRVPVTIPTELKEIKLSTYQKFQAIREDADDTDFLRQKVVQIFCNCDLDVVVQMKHKDVHEINAIIFTLLSKVPKLKMKFELKGIEFGFIPNLDEMTSGEYMDLDTYISDWGMMHKAMAVLYRPIVKRQDEKYLIEPYKGTEKFSELMKDAPLDVVLSAYVFFWTLGKDLLTSTIAYLTAQQKKGALPTLETLGSDGDGIQALTASLEEMFKSMDQLQNYQSTNA